MKIKCLRNLQAFSIPRSAHYSSAVYLESVIRNEYLLSQEEYSSNDILKVQAILDINAYEVQLGDTNIQAAYKTASLAEHNCTPNAHKSICGKQILITNHLKSHIGNNILLFIVSGHSRANIPCGKWHSKRLPYIYHILWRSLADMASPAISTMVQIFHLRMWKMSISHRTWLSISQFCLLLMRQEKQVGTCSSPLPSCEQLGKHR